MATWTGIRDLETNTPDVTTDGVVITQVNAMQAGDGVTNTTLRLGDIPTGKLRVLRMNNQIRTTVNPDRSPCLDFSDTLIIKTTGNTCFTKVTAGTTPLIRFRRVAMSYLAGGPFLFMENDNRVQSIFEDVVITIDSYGFAFFGREAIWNNVVIRGNATGDTFPPNLPLEINGLKLYDHNLMKLEHGSGGMYTVQMLNSAGVTSTSGFLYSGFGASTVSDQTDRTMHLVDSPIDTFKCSMSNNGAIGTWRTVKATYKTALGVGVSGAKLYTAYNNGSAWVDYRLSRTRNTSVTAGTGYIAQATADQDPALPTAQTLRWFYILRPNDRVRLSGFSNAANNIDTSVVGLLNSTTNKYYATADRLIPTSPSGLVTEASKLATITRLEPISDSNGLFTETLLEIGFARSLNTQGGNAYGTTFTLGNYQSGAQTGVAGQTFKREQWELYLVPPYPYKRDRQEFAVPQSAPSLGAKVEWNPLSVTDSEITQTNKTTVLDYTTLETSAKLYDYKEAWKRENENALIGGVREDFFTKSGSTLDFGSWNLVIDPSAGSVFAVNTGTKTITIKATTFTGNVKTTGTVTFSGGVVQGTVTGNVVQNTPTNLSNLNITGSLTYNTNTNTSITLTNCAIGSVANSGAGIVTIAKAGTTTVTTYTDAEINYLDSTLTVIGATSVTAYPSASDRNNNTNAIATWSGTTNFKYAAPWNSTVYLKLDIGFIAYKDVVLTLGDNTVDIGTTGQLAVIQSTLDTKLDVAVSTRSSQVTQDAIASDVIFIKNEV